MTIQKWLASLALAAGLISTAASAETIRLAVTDAVALADARLFRRARFLLPGRPRCGLVGLGRLPVGRVLQRRLRAAARVRVPGPLRDG